MTGEEATYWDRLYTSDPDFFGAGASSLARTALGPLLREVPGGRLAELGCGTGQDLCYFASHGLEVEGCDLSPVACRRTNERLADLRGETPPRSHARPEDALRFLAGHPAACLDVVYANLYLNLETEPVRLGALAGAVARVVKPQGWWLVRVRSTRDPWYGRGTRLADTVYAPGGDRPALRFFSEADVRGLAGSAFEAAVLQEHADGEPEFPVTVFDASLRRRP